MEPYDLGPSHVHDVTITLGDGTDALTVNGMFVPYPEVAGRGWEHVKITMNGTQYQALLIECGSFLRRHDATED